MSGEKKIPHGDQKSVNKKNHIHKKSKRNSKHLMEEWEHPLSRKIGAFFKAQLFDHLGGPMAGRKGVTRNSRMLGVS